MKGTSYPSRHPLRVSLENAQEAHATLAPNHMVRYRILTERFENLVSLVAAYYDGATFVHGEGSWKGQTERSTAIEVIGTPSDRERILSLARWIREVNNQESVFVEVSIVELVKVEGK